MMNHVIRIGNVRLEHVLGKQKHRKTVKVNQWSIINVLIKSQMVMNVIKDMNVNLDYVLGI